VQTWRRCAEDLDLLVEFIKTVLPAERLLELWRVLVSQPLALTILSASSPETLVLLLNILPEGSEKVASLSAEHGSALNGQICSLGQGRQMSMLARPPEFLHGEAVSCGSWYRLGRQGSSPNFRAVKYTVEVTEKSTK